MNERLSRSHGSHWWGAIIMWMRGCSVHTVAANEGLLSCEWEVVPYTRQPLMRGWYPVSEELSDCALQTAERRSEAGLHAYTVGFSVRHSAATWDPFAPASALSSPHRHGRGAWEAGLMSCPAGSTVRGMRTFSRHELITWVPKVHDQRADGLPLRNVILTWMLQRSSHEACPRMSEP